VKRRRDDRDPPAAAERAFRDAVRDILESEGWFELDVEEPRRFRYIPFDPMATA
jgi:hypothetical protein